MNIRKISMVIGFIILTSQMIMGEANAQSRENVKFMSFASQTVTIPITSLADLDKAIRSSNLSWYNGAVRVYVHPDVISNQSSEALADKLTRVISNASNATFSFATDTRNVQSSKALLIAVNSAANHAPFIGQLNKRVGIEVAPQAITQVAARGVMFDKLVITASIVSQLSPDDRRRLIYKNGAAVADNTDALIFNSQGSLIKTTPGGMILSINQTALNDELNR